MKKTIILTSLFLLLAWGAKEWIESLTALGNLAFGRGAPHAPSMGDRLMPRQAGLIPPRFGHRPSAIPRPRAQGEIVGYGSSTGGSSSYLPAVSPKDAADQYMAENRSRLNIQDYHQLKPTVYTSPLGSHVKYSVFQDGLPILGMNIDVEVKDRQVAGVDSQYQPLKRVDVTGNFLSTEEIVQQNSDRYAPEPSSTQSAAKVLYVSSGSDEPEVAYVIPMTDTSTRRPVQMIFRASDGQILGRTTSRAENFGQ